MTGSSWQEIMAWPADRKAEELEYMRHTIQSQFEFVDYIFVIRDVTRAFTHQLVRHRIGTSFAQQTQRSVNMSQFEYLPIEGATPDQTAAYNIAMAEINCHYQDLLSLGMNRQDARGVLPTNIYTNIVFKANLRTLHDMALKRLCVKTQGEFQNVFRLMRKAILEVHPWAEPFIRVWCAVHGTCQFHTLPLAECPVKKDVYNPSVGCSYGGGKSLSPDLIQIAWEQNRAEFQPKSETSR